MSTAPDSDLNKLIGGLTTWTNVILLVALAVTIGLVVYPTLTGAGAEAPAPPPPPAYEVGSVIDTPGDWHSGAPFTLVLFAQASCGACQRAQPFLAQLVSEIGERTPVVIVSPGPDQDQEAEFAATLGLAPSAVRQAPAGIRARVTPTLVLVNRDGTVLQVWEGVPPAKHGAILEAVRTTTRRAS